MYICHTPSTHFMTLNDTLEVYIKTTSMALSRMYNAIAASYGISQTMGYILIYVEKEGTPSTKLAKLLGMKISSLTRILKNMEADGSIYKKLDDNDKRITRVFLTELGLEKRIIAKKTVLEFNEKLLNNIGEADLQAFFNVFKIINQHIKIETDKLYTSGFSENIPSNL